ncbi:MAG: YggS family pyridoxal phosphate-dependent enzyme [Thermoanaerobaculia bacterium]
MTPLSSQEIGERRERILASIARASERAGRDPAEVAILAVTKTHTVETIRNAVHAGITRLGENRVAEGAAKIEALRGEFPGLEWRLIGPLQTNKVKPALQYFAVVESLDRERLATRLNTLLAAEGRSLPVLLEFNLAGEASKSGAGAGGAEGFAAATLAFPHLDVRGVMAVPPLTADPQAARPYFRQLRQIRERLSDRFGRPFPEISMGMSHDFEVAVEEGATQVRIGTALFGPREAA